MKKTVQELSRIPIKFGYEYYTIIPRIITRWCKKGKIKSEKINRRYYIEEKEFIDYARMHYYKR